MHMGSLSVCHNWMNIEKIFTITISLVSKKSPGTESSNCSIGKGKIIWMHDVYRVMTYISWWRKHRRVYSEGRYTLNLLHGRILEISPGSSDACCVTTYLWVDWTSKSIQLFPLAYFLKKHNGWSLQSCYERSSESIKTYQAMTYILRIIKHRKTSVVFNKRR